MTVSEDLWRRAAPQVLAALTRRYGDFDAAEDAVQEALLAASRQWPEEGVPDDPVAWLVRVASRRLIDHWRAERSRTAREDRVAREDVCPTAATEPVTSDTVADTDDSLLVLLLCCHPSLPLAAQVALTLRAVGGLTTAQIARGFLVPEATMAQRISRAKTTLRRSGARFHAVRADELPNRINAVCQVLYLIFTEGHASSTGRQLYDVSLSGEAIRLTRMLHHQLPAASEVSGLLALMLLTDARRAVRLAADGSLVPLAEQDRHRWDAAAIAEGVALVEAALPVGPVGPYQLQAAIAAVHAEAVRAEDTDWPQIALLYAMLDRIAPGPMVTLNRAVAVAMVSGPEEGLRLLAPLEQEKSLRQHHRLPAVRGHLLERSGRLDEARLAYATAARLATNVPEQRYLSERAARLSPTTTRSRRGGGLSQNDVMTADNSSTDATPTEDETKRKFREALEAKKGRKGEDHLDGGTHPAQPHGKVDAKRVFRRKSG